MKGELRKSGQLITQILAVIVVFGIIAYGLWRIDLLKLPSFIENLLVSGDEPTEDYASDGYEIFGYINSDAASTEKELIYPTVSTENLAALLNTAIPYENYYWESRSELISSSGSVVTECKSRISGNRYNVEISDNNGNTVRRYISDGESTLVSKSSRGGINSSKIYRYGLVDFYADASLISIDYFKDGEFSDDNTEIRFINENGYNMLSLVYIADRNGVTVRNEFLISLDYGVVLFAECYEKDTLVYSLHTDSIYSLSSLDDELFKIQN